MGAKLFGDISSPSMLALAKRVMGGLAMGTRESPGLLGGLAQGGAEGMAAGMDSIDRLRGAMSPDHAYAYSRQGWPTPGETYRSQPGFPQYQVPEDSWVHPAYEAAKMAPAAALLAPMSLAAGPAGLAMDAGGALIGSAASDYARQQGAGSGLQGAIDMAGNAFGPGALTSLAAVPAMLVKDAEKGGLKAAAKAAAKAAGKVGGLAKKPLPKAVEEAMRAVRFREVDPAEFTAARDVARAGKRGGYLSDTPAEKLAEAGTRTFLSEDGNVGYALSKDGDAQGVFNKAAEGQEDPRPNAGKFALIDQIRGGATTLDAYDGYLTNDLYPQYGFAERERAKWRDEDAPANWDYEKNGRPDVVFMERSATAEPMDPRKMARTIDPLEMRKRYPYVGLPDVGVDKTSGKLFLSKGPTPEGDALMKLRTEIGEQIKAGNYEPFFPVDKRFDVDASQYDMPQLTTETIKKTQAANDLWRGRIDTPESRQRLKTAYEKGLSEMSKDWYMLGQLEEHYIGRLGAERGRAKFQEHMEGIAATTGGSDPTANWLMARYAAFENAKGRAVPEAGAFMPSPIGGQYAGNNTKFYNNLMRGSEGLDPVKQPKRYDFTRNFLGQVDSGTIDEQMTQLMTPELHIEEVLSKAKRDAGVVPKVRVEVPLRPPEATYGIYQDVIRSVAEELGIDPRMLQEVAWAGTKGTEGKPMIQHINESIERTSKITKMSPQDVVNGWIDETLPAFGIAGGAGIGAGGSGMLDEKRKKKSIGRGGLAK